MRIRRHALAGFVVLAGSVQLLSSGSPALAVLAPAGSNVGPGQIEPPNATPEFEELGPPGQQQRRAVIRLRTVREADVPNGPVEFWMPKTFLAKEPVVFEGMIVPVDPRGFRGAILVEMFIVREDGTRVITNSAVTLAKGRGDKMFYRVETRAPRRTAPGKHFFAVYHVVSKTDHRLLFRSEMTVEDP